MLRDPERPEQGEAQEVGGELRGPSERVVVDEAVGDAPLEVAHACKRRDPSLHLPTSLRRRHPFEAFVEHVLVPELQPGDVVVMDNLSSHKRGWDERWEEFSDWADKGKVSQEELLGLIDEDEPRVGLEQHRVHDRQPDEPRARPVCLDRHEVDRGFDRVGVAHAERLDRADAPTLTKIPVLPISTVLPVIKQVRDHLGRLPRGRVV